MAIATGVLAPWVGRIVDRYHPRPIIGFGFSMLAVALTWLSVEMTPTTPIWRIVLPLTATGIGMAFIWSPLAATATRNLAPSVAGAGSGVYNATRQVGSVLGSASMAAFMTTRISAEMPLAADGPTGEGSVTTLPGFLHEPFAAAMSQSLLLPAFIALFGVVAAMFLLGFASAPAPVSRRDEAADEYWDDDLDDDHYVEFTVVHDEPAPAVADPIEPVEEEGDTEPMAARGPEPHVPVEPALPPEESSQPLGHRREPVRNLYEFLSDVPPPKPSVEPIGFAHNGFHTDEEKHFQPLSRFQQRETETQTAQPPKPDILSSDYPVDIGSHARFESPDEAGLEPPSRHGLIDDETTANGRHSRAEVDDAPSYGRRGRHTRNGDYSNSTAAFR